MERSEKIDKNNMVRNQFRRSSSADHETKSLLVEVKEMPTILNRMGQKVDERKLFDFIDKHVDKEHTGHLDYDKFTKVCNKFLTDAALLERIKGDDFEFKNLITPDDFSNP